MTDRDRSVKGQRITAALFVAAGLIAGARAVGEGFWEPMRGGVPLGPAAVVLVLVGVVLGYRALRA